MQGHMESQCWNKVRDDRIKKEREERSNMEKGNTQQEVTTITPLDQNREKKFQTVTRRKNPKNKNAPKINQHMGT